MAAYLAASHYLAGRYRESLAASERALRLNPDDPLALRYLIATLGRLDRAADASAAIALLRRTDRDRGGLETVVRRLFAPSAADRILAGLRKAGMG